MSSRKKIVLKILLIISCIALVGAAVLYNYSYKLCWMCSTQDYYERGKELVCRNKEELRQTGLDFLRLAADRQQIDAQILLGECYLDELPEGYISCNATALDCLNRQLNNNPTVAAQLFNQAYTLLRQQELTAGSRLFNFALLAKNGILAGNNPQQDAHTLCLQAAEQGNYAAMSFLALEYHQKSDYAAAKKWLSRIVETGKDAEPALMLGDYFIYGRGGVIDYEKAIYWYRMALKTQKTLWAHAGEEEQLAAKDVPMARIEMAMRRLKKDRLSAPLSLHYRISGNPMSLHYSISGNARRYIVHTEDRLEGPVGIVEKTVKGINAQLDDSIALPLSIPISRKSFKSMNDGMEWVLHSYARSRYGSDEKFNFILKR